MVGLLELRQKIKAIYAEYSAYIVPCIKFFAVLITLMTMNNHIGYMARLDSMTIVLLVSLVCCILPMGATAFFVSVFMLAHLSSLSLVATGVALVVLLLMFCTYYLFQPKDSILLCLVPVLFVFKIPYLAPLVMGLVGSFMSAIPVSFGVILYYMLRWIKANSSVLASSSTLEPLQQLSEMVTGIMKNEEMMVFIIAFVATLLVVYLFRRMPVKYCWEIAIGMGTLVDIMILLIGSSSLDLTLPMGTTIVGALVSALLALVLEFFVFLVDFSRTVQTQFEDDEYYYYVKAVPKMTVTPTQKKVKKIASPKKRAVDRIEEEEELRRREVIAQARNEKDEEADWEIGESEALYETKEIVVSEEMIWAEAADEEETAGAAETPEGDAAEEEIIDLAEESELEL